MAEGCVCVCICSKNTYTSACNNSAEVTKMSKQIKEAEKADVHVVDEAFLDGVAKGGAALLITQHSIAGWGSDVSVYFLPNSLTLTTPKNSF